MVRSTSLVWNHFDPNPSTKIATCHYCQKHLSYKTTSTNLKQHLRVVHNSIYNEIDFEDPNQKTTSVQTVKKRVRPTTIWEHFEREPNTETAECDYCRKSISYRTTTSNLKQHLKVKHWRAYKKFLKSYASEDEDIEDGTEDSVPTNEYDQNGKKFRIGSSPVWKHFDIFDRASKIAVCKYCKDMFSFKSSITNIKGHLRAKHIDAYNELKSESLSVNEKQVSTLSECDETTKDDPDEDAEELLKLSGIWSYFEQESGRKARCVVCRTTISSSYDELKAHLSDSHPKLLLQIMQDKDENSDAASNQDDNDNTYTEIVYLEQDSLQEETHTPKEKRKSVVKPQHVPRKRERIDSSFEDIVIKRRKEDDDDELGAFIKYITCLLRKLPQNVFSNVQAEIISTILKASANATASSSRVILNSEVINIPNSGHNVVTVNEITPNNSAILGTHNYTITVGPKEDEKLEKS